MATNTIGDYINPIKKATEVTNDDNRPLPKEISFEEETLLQFVLDQKIPPSKTIRLLSQYESTYKKELDDRLYWFLVGVCWNSYKYQVPTPAMQALFTVDREHKEYLMKPSEEEAYNHCCDEVYAFATPEMPFSLIVDQDIAFERAVLFGHETVASYKFNKSIADALFTRNSAVEFIMATNLHKLEFTGNIPVTKLEVRREYLQKHGPRI